MPVGFGERRHEVVLHAVVDRPSRLPAPVVLHDDAQLTAANVDRRRDVRCREAVLPRGLLRHPEQKVREILPLPPLVLSPPAV